MASTVALFNKQTGALKHKGTIELLSTWDTKTELIWIDLQSGDDGFERDILEQKFNVPSLMADDALRPRHPPKFEHTDKFVFLLLRGLSEQTDTIEFKTIQIALFFGEGWLVTRHIEHSPSIAQVARRCDEAELMPQNSAQLCYAICRRINERYLPIVLQLEDRLEDIENLLLEHSDDTLLKELMVYSRELKKLRRVADYHHQAYKAFSEYESNHLPELVHEKKDLVEQSERLLSLSNLFKDITADLINGYISVSSHRLNQIMKVLTIVTVIFVPLTFMAGIYGMNFEYIPELKWKWAYFTLLGVMFTTAIALLVFFKKRKWL